eukprot:NODE_440_length_7390_cov_0.787546.p10 type:complete len:113 gc:universal NODE_440_length_7390_cov_0.787546:6423-6085(-)
MSQVIDTLSASFQSLSESKRKEMLSKINSIFIIEIDGTKYVLDFKSGNIKKHASESGDVTILLKEKDLMDIVQGKLTSQNAFMKGKLKIKGNMMTALKLDSALKTLQQGAKL